MHNIGHNQPVKVMADIEALENALGKKGERNYLPIQRGDVPATCANTVELDAWVGFKPAPPVKEGVEGIRGVVSPISQHPKAMSRKLLHPIVGGPCRSWLA